MKKFFSLVLALVMALSLTTVAWGELTAMPGAVDNKIVLEDDVVLTSTYEVADTLTIDLNGHTISGTDTAALYSLIHVKNGANLTIKDSVGTGKISYDAGTGDKTGVAVWVEGVLTLKSGTIEITGDWVIGFAVDVRPNAWGTAYTEAASFTMDGGKIVASDSGVRVTSNSSDSYPNLGVTFTMNGGTIDSAYDGIFVQNVSYDDTLTVEVVGGTVTSENTHAVRIYGNSDDKVDVEMSITGGSFTGEMTNLDQTGTGEVAISGGTFTDDVSEYVAAGSSAVLSGGKLVVSVGNTGNTNSYDASDVTIVAKDGSKVIIATDAKVVMTQESKKTVNGKFASVIPAHFTYNGVKYVVCHEMSATHLVTVKGVQYYTCAFNGFVPTVEKDGGALYTAPKKATCGKVGANEDKYVVIDNIYYLVSNLGTRYVLVNDKMVVYSTTTATAEVHVYDAVKSELKYNSDRTVANFKCAVCNNAIPVVAKKPAFATNYTAITLGVEGTYYYVTNTAGISAGSTTPSTDKTVTSAETFDAGIAMYVGMSVMATAGSVVVLKKRED